MSTLLHFASTFLFILFAPLSLICLAIFITAMLTLYLHIRLNRIERARFMDNRVKRLEVPNVYSKN